MEFLPKQVCTKVTAAGLEGCKGNEVQLPFQGNPRENRAC